MKFVYLGNLRCSPKSDLRPPFVLNNEDSNFIICDASFNLSSYHAVVAINCFNYKDVGVTTYSLRYMHVMPWLNYWLLTLLYNGGDVVGTKKIKIYASCFSFPHEL